MAAPDNDGMADVWEMDHFGTISTLPGDDPDLDGASNLLEFQSYTNPYVADTDGDGLPDGINHIDSNGDGIMDGYALRMGFSPTSLDNDGDGISNLAEIAAGTNIFLADSDQDTIADNLDFFPLDPTRWDAPAGDPADVTPPQLFLDLPHDATPL